MPGKTKGGDTGDVACDSYHRWAEDMELMKALHLQAYRFSIAWPRIFPAGTGAVNPAGLAWYDRFVDALLAAGISATPVTLAAKSMLRGGRPVVIGVSTNDGLSGSVGALAALLQRKNYYFIPFGQDDSYKKPCSLKADFTQLPDTLEAALRGVQLQPILL